MEELRGTGVELADQVIVVGRILQGWQEARYESPPHTRRRLRGCLRAEGQCPRYEITDPLLLDLARVDLLAVHNAWDLVHSVLELGNLLAELRPEEEK